MLTLLILALLMVFQVGDDPQAPPVICDNAMLDNRLSVLNLMEGNEDILRFDGLQSQVRVPHHDRLNFGTSDLSFSIEFRVTQSVAGVQVLFDKRYEFETTQGLHLYLYQDQLGMQLADGLSNPEDDHTNYTSSVPVADGEWHHAAVTIDRDYPRGGRMYLDGELILIFDPSNHTGSLNVEQPFYLGRRSSSDTGHFSGEIASLYFYDCILSPAQVSTLPTSPLLLSPEFRQALALAQVPVNANADWTPFAQDFDLPGGGTVTMMLVPAGSFQMGSTQKETHAALEMCQQEAQGGRSCNSTSRDGELGDETNIQTFAQPFWIDQHEVTRAHYQVCVDAAVCGETTANDASTEPDHPINYTTLFQAQVYCEWRGARLPTEAEWEYAARGPDRLIFPWGDTFNEASANHCDRNCAETDWADSVVSMNAENDDGYALISPVGSYPEGASWVGALDMSGNVWEWTSSRYLDYPYDRSHESPFDQFGSHVIRGGSFYNATNFLRTAARSWTDPATLNDGVGFRCVRDVDQTAGST